TTLGTATCGRPEETTSDTALPTLTCVPLIGDWLMTDPAGTVVLVAVVTVPTTRPTFVIAVVAAVCVSPTTLGTATCGRPVEITSVTTLPTVTCVPAVGDWLITEPAGTVVLAAVESPSPRLSPAPMIAVLAAVCVTPTTFGTATWAGPLETVRLTALPGVTRVPPPGFWLMTDPAGTVALAAVAIVPTVRPADVIAELAAVCVRPTTAGTETGAGPDETISATELPGAACEPASGLCVMTEPAGTVALVEFVTDPRASPAPVMADVAAACVRPTTFGTVTWAAPATRISIAERFQRSVLGSVSFKATAVPAAATAAERACTQKVSPTPLSTHWCTIAWPVPTVRGVALSQSLPTP